MAAIGLHELHCYGMFESQGNRAEVAVVDNGAASTESGSYSFVRGLPLGKEKKDGRNKCSKWVLPGNEK